MSHANSATNGASLEDCHANFYALTDVCGIKWVVYREDDSNLATTCDLLSDDPVLASFSRCMDAEVLAVWRRVPKRDLVTYDFDMSGNRVPNKGRDGDAREDERGLLGQRKELWLFWYGDKSDDHFRKLISSKLKEVSDLSGTWENGLPYQARTLLFKALNNLIERNLVSRDFVRLGKWFVQPFDGPDKFSYYPSSANPAPSSAKSTHLSFSFNYFIHGESSVCASLDVRQHPPVRKLSLHHISLAKAQTTPVHVILAPYGVAGTLTGVTYKRDDRNIEKVLREWNSFYKLRQNYYCHQQNEHEVVPMPIAVEVLIAGVKMIYPTCFVLVSDLDISPDMLSHTITSAIPRAMQTCLSAENVNSPCFEVEPSPFSACNHPLLLNEVESCEASTRAFPESRTELAWQDGLCINPEGSAHGHQQQNAGDENTPTLIECLNQWEFSNPSKVLKKRSSRKNYHRERSRDARSKFSSKIPFHKKNDVVEDLAWTLDHTDMLCGGSQSRIKGNNQGMLRGLGTPASASMGPPGSVKGASNTNEHTAANSPGSIGTPVSVFTPKAPGAPGSVKTPGDPATLLMSPHQPPSNGPHTPMDSGNNLSTSTSLDQKHPQTPKSVPPPSYSIASPYGSLKKQEVKQEESGQELTAIGCQSSIIVSSLSGTQNPYTNSATSTTATSTSSTTVTTLLLRSFKQDHSSELEFVPGVGVPLKRPMLPLKEYESEIMRESNLSDLIYDYQALQHWLNHPVKKFKPSDLICQDDHRKSQGGVLTLTQTTADNLQPGKINDQINGYLEDSNIKEENMMDTYETVPIKTEPGQFQGKIDPDSAIAREKNISGGNKPEEERTDLYSTEGLKPTMDDLNNLFEDSSDETDADGAAPTPPNSNQPADTNHNDDIITNNVDEVFGSHGLSNGKISTKSALKLTASKRLCQQQQQLDPTLSSLQHDQLAKMFPTPPSHEPHDHHDHGDFDHMMIVKGESSLVTSGGYHDLMEWIPFDELASTAMLSSPKFTPVRLYSEENPVQLPEECKYNPKQRSTRPQMNCANNSSQNHSTSNNHSKLSPFSPMTSVEGGPRSHHGPGSVPAYSGASPNPSNSNYMNKTSSSSGAQATGSGSCASSNSQNNYPKADSLLMNLILSDSLLNVFFDHNFDSCTLCVCNNEGNIKGRDASVYLPSEFGTSAEDDINCNCGFSAVANRKLAHRSGLFYEDESEVTSIKEDFYERKKPSLLLLDPKRMTEEGQQGFSEKAAIVDAIPRELLELLHVQSAFFLSSQNSLYRYARKYLKLLNHHQQHSPPLNMVELLDGNEVIFSALGELVKKSTSTQTPEAPISKPDENEKGTCLHKWTLFPAPGPFCSEDVIRVMKFLQPILNTSLHAKESSSNLSVQGPLTWRQFHRMAGPATKGHTDDQCEPLPVPSVSVGHEKDVVTLSPLALHFWESLNLEPFSQPRDVVYIVVAPDNDFLLDNVKTFFKNLSNVYEMCRLGQHVPYSKLSFLKVGKNAANKLSGDETDRWFDQIGEYPAAALLKLYSLVCRHYLLPLLLNMNLDRSLLDPPKPILAERYPQSPMPSAFDGNLNTNSMLSGGNPTSMTDGVNIKTNNSLDDSSAANYKENMNNFNSTSHGANNSMDSPLDDGEGYPLPAVVIYMVDPFSFGVDNVDSLRLCNLALMRCYLQVLPNLREPLKHNIFLQTVSLESILELTQSPSLTRMPNMLKNLAFSVYSQTQKAVQCTKDCKTLTGFGPASSVERLLKLNEDKAKFVSYLHQPAVVLAPPPLRKRLNNESETVGSSSVLFINYCLSEDQHWLLAACSDDKGELVKTTVINVEIPNKTRRKKASARRVGLRKLMDWILSVLAMSLVPWRIVIGRIGRIGHGELRGWSVLLSRKSLKKASKLLRETCPWPSDFPSILSACLVSMEPDANLRVMADQFTPDERFGQTASNCQLSTPKDASCTHILVFPTSATAQSAQKVFEDHQDGIGSGPNDLNDFGLPMDLGDIEGGDNDGLGDIGDLKDIFSTGDWGAAGIDQPGSPGSPSGKRNSLSAPNSPSQQMSGSNQDAFFRYGQEDPADRLEILHQPLALGYMVSTASTGHMPKWFWANCPHLENVNPVFLKSALHINQGSVQQGGDDGFMSTSASGRVHSLDSTYTTDVLRYVLEGYNALSWLSIDQVSHDRRSCMPIHVQILQQMYANFAAIV